MKETSVFWKLAECLQSEAHIWVWWERKLGGVQVMIQSHGGASHPKINISLSSGPFLPGYTLGMETTLFPRTTDPQL